MRSGTLIILAAVLVGAGGAAERATPAASSAADDVRLLMAQIRQIHPNPFHATPEPAFQAAADDLAARAPSLSQDQLLVELMRFANLLGERDGHSGIFPLDTGNRRVLHLFPLYLYKFSDGLFVVSAPGNKALVGSKVLAIDGIGVDELERQVRPLVPRDNEHTRTDRFMSFLLTAEILHGLGLRAGTGPASFTVQAPAPGAAGRRPRAGHGGPVPGANEAGVPVVRVRPAETVCSAVPTAARECPIRHHARPRTGRLRRLQPHARLDLRPCPEGLPPGQAAKGAPGDRRRQAQPRRGQPHVRAVARCSALEADQQAGQG